MNTFRKYLLVAVIAFGAAAHHTKAASLVEQDVADNTFLKADSWASLASVQALGITEENVNQRYIGNRTPLMFACQHNAPLDVIGHLLALGAKTNLLDHDYLSPVDIASEQGNFGIVKCLLDSGAVANWKSVRFACRSGSLEIVEMLHEKGADLLYCDAINCFPTAIHDACQGGNLDLVKYLVSKGVLEVVFSNKLKGKDTPLHVASACGHKDIVQYCVDDLGIRVDEIGFNGMSPLYRACQNYIPSALDENRFEIAEFLIQKGANTNFVPEFRSVPGVIAKGRAIFAEAVASNPRNSALLVLLARYGADVDAVVGEYSRELVISSLSEETQVVIRAAAAEYKATKNS